MKSTKNTKSRKRVEQKEVAAAGAYVIEAVRRARFGKERTLFGLLDGAAPHAPAAVAAAVLQLQRQKFLDLENLAESGGDSRVTLNALGYWGLLTGEKPRYSAVSFVDRAG